MSGPRDVLRPSEAEPRTLGKAILGGTARVIIRWFALPKDLPPGILGSRRVSVPFSMATALVFHFTGWIEDRFELPETDLPDLSREPNPEAAADSLRRGWSLGALSIRNMIHLLEAKGVRVLSLAVDAREVDAFSIWKGARPFVFLIPTSRPNNAIGGGGDHFLQLLFPTVQRQHQPQLGSPY